MRTLTPLLALLLALTAFSACGDEDLEFGDANDTPTPDETSTPDATTTPSPSPTASPTVGL